MEKLFWPLILLPSTSHSYIFFKSKASPPRIHKLVCYIIIHFARIKTASHLFSSLNDRPEHSLDTSSLRNRSVFHLCFLMKPSLCPKPNYVYQKWFMQLIFRTLSRTPGITHFLHFTRCYFQSKT